jgi:L,D-transpeptidase catalytic domain
VRATRPLVLIAALVSLGVLLASAEDAGASSWTRLSDEATLSRWAHPSYPSRVRISPYPRSRTLTRLHYLTEDGRPEIYLALSKFVDDDGTSWVRIRLPMRPIGTKGWVKRSALGGFHVVREALLVNRKALKATLYRKGRRIWRAPVGIGRPGLATPAGHFYVRETLESLDPFYGAVAFGTSAYSHFTDWPGGGVVGIHGTSQPWLIPGRPSHGCVRVRNEDIVKLEQLMPLGTPIRIR